MSRLIVTSYRDIMFFFIKEFRDAANQGAKATGGAKAELARRACLNPTTVGLIESGRFHPYPGQLQKLAAALDWPKAEAEQLLSKAAQGRMDSPTRCHRKGSPIRFGVRVMRRKRDA